MTTTKVGPEYMAAAREAREVMGRTIAGARLAYQVEATLAFREWARGDGSESAYRAYREREGAAWGQHEATIRQAEATCEATCVALRRDLAESSRQASGA